MPDTPKIDWVPLKKWKPDPIGFIGDNIVAIAAFYGDPDADRDGKISIGEWIGSKLPPVGRKGAAITEVTIQARVEPDILLRDPSIARMSANLFLSYASGLLRKGAWLAYFKPGVSMGAKGVARIVTDSMVKQIVIRKGFEKAVEDAFRAAAGGY